MDWIENITQSISSGGLILALERFQRKFSVIQKPNTVEIVFYSVSDELLSLEQELLFPTYLTDRRGFPVIESNYISEDLIDARRVL